VAPRLLALLGDTIHCGKSPVNSRSARIVLLHTSRIGPPSRDRRPAITIPASDEGVVYIRVREPEVPPLPGLSCYFRLGFPRLPLHFVQGMRGGLRCGVPPGLSATWNWSTTSDDPKWFWAE